VIREIVVNVFWHRKPFSPVKADEQNVVPEHAIRCFGNGESTGACPVNISVTTTETESL
jgi:hypothetical protein